MTKEEIQEYLDCNGFEALTAFDGTKYYNEKTVLSIALEIVKNCSIPDVVKPKGTFCQTPDKCQMSYYHQIGDYYCSKCEKTGLA